MLAPTVRAVEWRGETAGGDSLEIAASRAGGVRTLMGGPNVGIGVEGADRTVSFANTGYMAILPAAQTLGEFVAGIGELNSPGLGLEPDGGTELLDIIGGDRDDN